jgi:hypothetical protein
VAWRMGQKGGCRRPLPLRPLPLRLLWTAFPPARRHVVRNAAAAPLFPQ